MHQTKKKKIHRRNDLRLVLQTAVWYRAVECALGLSHAHAVEALLEPHLVRTIDGVPRSSKWHKFKSGKHTPKATTVGIGELAAPGTAKWLHSPIWDALGGKLSNRLQVEDHLRSNLAVRKVLFREFHFDNELNYLLDVKLVPHCASLDGLDLLEATILLLELGVLARNPVTHTSALDLYVVASAKIAELPQLRLNFAMMFDQIERRHFGRVNVDWDTAIPPWFIRLPDKQDPMVDWDEIYALGNPAE